MKNCLLIIFATYLLLISSSSAFANSSYVLPYPSFMPGSTFYKLHLVWEKIEKYWYFGDFGQFNYNLKQSDRYLVEAKTLFEYQQYLLASKALQKSDKYFKEIPTVLIKARKNKKNIIQKEKRFKDASLKHIEELGKIYQEVPKNFIWKPEKDSSTILDLQQLFIESIKIRKNIL